MNDGMTRYLDCLSQFEQAVADAIDQSSDVSRVCESLQKLSAAFHMAPTLGCEEDFMQDIIHISQMAYSVGIVDIDPYFSFRLNND